MTKLTDSQLIVLSAAAARDDGLAVAPAKMTKAAAAKVGASLITRKLMREVKAKPGMPVWRHDEEGRPLSLAITKAGNKESGVEEADAVENPNSRTKRNGSKSTVGRDARARRAALGPARSSGGSARGLKAGAGDQDGQRLVWRDTRRASISARSLIPSTPKG